MRRGDLYLVQHPAGDPKRSRVFVIVSRPVLIESRFSTVICAPIYSRHDGTETQVPVGPAEGLKHASSIHCDELVSILKVRLTDFVGSLTPAHLAAVRRALRIALYLE